MSRMKKMIALSLALVLSLCFSLSMLTASYASQPVKDPNVFKGKVPKYVFLFIGDGMGMPQINAAEDYLGKLANAKGVIPQKLNVTQFPVVGMSTTYDADSFIPDSASAGTAISTGYKTKSGVVGMDTTKTTKYPNIAEYAKMFGYKVGIISSVSIDHATPAVFYAHQPSRSNYYDIGMELANSDFDFFGGGGFLKPTGPNKDQKSVLDIAKENGFKVLTTTTDILAANSGSGRVLAINPTLDSESALPYDIDRKAGDLALADYVQKGIDVLDNPNGFFMMCEGGKIDWSCHANDAATTIKDVVAMDNAVATAKKFYDAHPDETLIIVTADHETGGLTIGFSGTGYSTFFDKISNQTKSYTAFDSLIAEYKKTHTSSSAKLEDFYADIKSGFGLLSPSDADAAAKKDMVLTTSEIASLRAALTQTMQDATARQNNYTDNDKILYGTYEPLSVTLTHILNNKAGLAWTTYAHSGVPVPVYAVGNGSDLFEGYYDDTDIFKKMMSILGLDRDRSIVVKIDNSSTGARNIGNKIMLPLGTVAKLLKGTVNTYRQDGKYIVKVNGNTMEFFLNDTSVVVNGSKYVLSSAPVLVNDLCRVPGDLFEYAGYTVTMDSEDNTVTLNFK